MSEQSENDALSRDGRADRAALIGRLRAAHRSRAMQPAPKRAPEARQPARSEAQTSGAFDFATLPRYQAMKMHRAAADMLGMVAPFFREHSGAPIPELEIAGAPRLNFASYNYLGLNGHPEVLDAANAAMAEHGISASASRVVGGQRPYHTALERRLAETYEVEDALVFVSGHATNVTVLGTMMERGDLILMDQLSHNSMTEGAKLSGAHRLVFPHNDLDWLDEKLGQIRGEHRNVLITVEGLYSMDGDSPDLARLIEIKNRHRAWLMVDEAHCLGVLGETGRGIAEAQGIDPRAVEIWMGTLSKTLGACGGYIAGSRALCDVLRYNAPGFVYSVGLSAPLAAGALKALELMHREPERVAQLHANGQRFLAKAREAGLDTGLSEGSAVTPIILGDSMRAALMSHLLLEAGVSALPIIYPAVPEKLARLRFFLTSDHTDEQIDRAIAAVLDCLPEADRRIAQLRG